MRIHGRYDRKGGLKKRSRTRRLLSQGPMCAPVLPSTWRIDNWLKWIGCCSRAGSDCSRNEVKRGAESEIPS
jgi:hypothetical protein